MAEESFFDKVEKIKMPIRLLILAGTIALIGGAFVGLVFVPKTEEISKLEKQIDTLSRKLLRAKVKAKDLKKFREERELVEVQFNEALKLLPDKKEIPSLLKEITKLGSESQLEFRLFTPQGERAKDFYMEIPVSIEVSGSYHNVAVFFDKVGKMERIVNILNVNMRPAKARSTNLITKCDAVTYRFKEGSIDAKATKTK